MSLAADADLSAALRGRTPAVLRAAHDGWTLLDGPSGTQLVTEAIDASAQLAMTGVSNRHALAPHGAAIEALVAQSRAELRELFDAEEYEVVFGQNMTSLAFSLAHSLARTFDWNDKHIAVTELDHCANIDPWVQAIGGAGATVDTITVDRDALDLSYGDLDALSPRLLAASAGSNAIGVQPNLTALGEFARAHEALFVLDCVQATPHGPPSLRDVGADIAFCSAYKLYGPHLGVAFIRRELADRLVAYKVAPGPTDGAEKFETGTQNFEAIAGMLGALDALAELSGGVGAVGARQTLLSLGHSEEAHAQWIAQQLGDLPDVHVYRRLEPRPGQTPIIAFTVAGRRPQDVAAALREHKVIVTSGDFYATPLARRLGVAESGGWVRAGISGYTSRQDCERLVDAVEAVVGG